LPILVLVYYRLDAIAATQLNGPQGTKPTTEDHSLANDLTLSGAIK